MSLRYVSLFVLFVLGVCVGFLCYPFYARNEDDGLPAHQQLVGDRRNEPPGALLNPPEGDAQNVVVPAYENGLLVEDCIAETAVWFKNGDVQLSNPTVFRYKKGVKRWFVYMRMDGKHGKIETAVDPETGTRTCNKLSVWGDTQIKMFSDPDSEMVDGVGRRSSNIQ